MATPDPRRTIHRYASDDPKALPGLRQRTFVERFGWKSRHTADMNMGSSALFNEDGGLTEVGATYADL